MSNTILHHRSLTVRFKIRQHTAEPNLSRSCTINSIEGSACPVRPMTFATSLTKQKKLHASATLPIIHCEIVHALKARRLGVAGHTGGCRDSLHGSVTVHLGGPPGAIFFPQKWCTSGWQPSIELGLRLRLTQAPRDKGQRGLVLN